ncbi:unnamed protein product [Caenorhabditis angaria]|uniref:Uncharacterized protein n=1 Tax=Caenorhabditis angaria TaxID=860376 RepID=A0A9P1J0P4_9PELO|nr:unnamed protein product [Caenorhabditis angaria]
MSNRHHCKNHRKSIQGDSQNQAKTSQNNVFHSSANSSSDNQTATTLLCDRPTTSASVTVPKFVQPNTRFQPVAKPILARFSKENVFANINYLMGNNN